MVLKDNAIEILHGGDESGPQKKLSPEWQPVRK